MENGIKTLTELRQRQRIIKESNDGLQREWREFLAQLTNTHIFVLNGRPYKVELGPNERPLIRQLYNTENVDLIGVDHFSFMLANAQLFEMYELTNSYGPYDDDLKGE